MSHTRTLHGLVWCLACKGVHTLTLGMKMDCEEAHRTLLYYTRKEDEGSMDSMYEKKEGWQAPKTWDAVREGVRVRVRWPKSALPAPGEMDWREGVCCGGRSFKVEGSAAPLPLPPLASFEIWRAQ